ncbi:helix-turn-helix domain-containing protein [Loigolactobacillus bifermentans]|nr:helix-turn-helix transcriptional regulator [Loigolactobacillus bifermentans]QGG61105.1 helix-turn-helix domain-containing protein [Loigolactobacillus bifermentans]
MNSNHIPNKIRYLRRIKGYSQFKLAELSDVSDSLIAKIEQGKVPNLSISMLAKISSGLGITLNDFFSDNITLSQSIITDKLEQLPRNKREDALKVIIQVLELMK